LKTNVSYHNLPAFHSGAQDAFFKARIKRKPERSLLMFLRLFRNVGAIRRETVEHACRFAEYTRLDIVRAVTNFAASQPLATRHRIAVILERAALNDDYTRPLQLLEAIDELVEVQCCLQSPMVQPALIDGSEWAAHRASSLTSSVLFNPYRSHR
jgi:hypothetical protein